MNYDILITFSQPSWKGLDAILVRRGIVGLRV